MLASGQSLEGGLAHTNSGFFIFMASVDGNRSVVVAWVL